MGQVVSIFITSGSVTGVTSVGGRVDSIVIRWVSFNSTGDFSGAKAMSFVLLHLCDPGLARHGSSEPIPSHKITSRCDFPTCLYVSTHVRIEYTSTAQLSSAQREQGGFGRAVKHNQPNSGLVDMGRNTFQRAESRRTRQIPVGFVVCGVLGIVMFEYQYQLTRPLS